MAAHVVNVSEDDGAAPTPTTPASRSCQDVAKEFDVDVTQGLGLAQISNRQKQYGRNVLENDEPESLVMKFLDQFKNPLNLLLVGSGGVSVLMGHLDDAISIVVALTIVVTVAFVQEYRSEKTLDALKELVPPRARAVRDGQTCEIDASDLVPGDVVVLSTGDRIPADARLVEAIDLDVDESSLTGETHVVTKHTKPIHSAHLHPIAERKNLVYMGTLVRGGRGKAIVYSTGRHTEFGLVFDVVDNVEERKTPLQERMDALAHQLSMVSLGVIGVIVLLGVAQGEPLFKMLQIGVSLAVAAIPEGLPICVTVTLALGVMRMAKRHAILKKLPAVEALGCTNILCVDKTGTLTTNQMAVVEVFFPGLGATPLALPDPSATNSHGSFKATFSPIFVSGVLCSNAEIVDGDVVGQATEGAIVLAATQVGLSDATILRQQYPRLQEIPFSSDSKFMAVQVATPQRTNEWHVKGMLEAVLPRCSQYQDASFTKHDLLPPDKDLISQTARTMARRGLRILALAVGSNSIESNMIFLGLVGISDPPRPGVLQTIRKLDSCGVTTVMLTGDALDTASAIAAQVGILTDSTEPTDEASAEAAKLLQSSDSVGVCSGQELDAMTDEEVREKVLTTRVFYRTCPTHKLKIVRAFQAHKSQVAMTGDGVNDAPALKAADIGIAMGTTGTDVSKEASDMILLDDNLTTILHAMAEAKGIYHNITHFLRFQLSTSVAALSLVAFSTLFDLPNPLNAMQILWINIIMDGPPAQSLGVEPVDGDVMREGPRAADIPIITRAMLKRIAVSALVIVSGTLFVFVNELDDDWQVTKRDRTMSFTTFVLFDMFNALSCRHETKSVFFIGWFSNAAFCIAVGASLVGQLMVIYVPFLQAIFQTEALSVGDLAYMTAIASSVFFVDEVRKWTGNSNAAKAALGRWATGPRKKKYSKVLDDSDTV
ncbi:calcium-transporting P-type ATPase, PMR1-type [Aphanomyces invadans]|uniref:Calcium-transporting ATPase n=1 Tax=Aphanomyces invadans TaxID=157072 RepID=A0A024TU31_9STRA|nr:calcium-transporting P-type ATPase, PMR1-type [Aphanomyces invadans]ETV97680.1 calcium-transporting P-type ATPase, PMR1-type [Aphanomyces invadans]|eukprot:XP_008873889.1 calcium-transporting P-type ATPase, PMR1-type [Aphanomyces invadans]